MTYDIKLKTGFFKTQQYILEISEKQLTLTPKDNIKIPNTVIKVSELNNVSVIKRSDGLTELEIIANNGVYIGNLDAKCNIDKLIYDFTKELGRKLIIQ